MNQLNFEKIVKFAGILLVLIIFGYLVFYIFSHRFSVSPLQVTSEPTSGTTSEITVENLKNITVPEPGEKVSENIAIPKEVVKANPKTDSTLRTFEIKGENGQLLPNDFRAYQDDIVNIKLTAVDQDYDFRLEGYNIQMKANKGETKTIEFQALNLGIYNFYCSLCKTKNNPAGKVVVVPK